MPARFPNKQLTSAASASLLRKSFSRGGRITICFPSKHNSLGCAPSSRSLNDGHVLPCIYAQIPLALFWDKTRKIDGGCQEKFKGSLPPSLPHFKSQPPFCRTDNLPDCADSECCLRPECKESLFCQSSNDPVEVLLRKQPPSVTASFYQRVKFLIEENSVQVYAPLETFTERYVTLANSLTLKCSLYANIYTSGSLYI